MIVKRKSASGLRYTARVYAGTDVNGKQITRNGPTRDTLAKAKEDELELLRLVERRYITSNTAKIVYFLDAAEAFTGSKKYKEYSDRTIEDFNYWMRREIVPVFGKAKLSSIKTNIIERWVEDMDERLSPSTWRKPYNFVKNILTYARRQGYMTFDPFYDAELPASTTRGKALATAKELPVWKPEQIQNFLSYIKELNDFCYPMYVLSFSLGLRPGEVCGLKIRDIGDNSLYIRQGLGRGGSETSLKTEGSHRVLPISEEVRSLLLTVAGKRDPSDYLFYNLKHHPVLPDVYSGRFRDHVARYNETHEEKLPVMPLYNARHSWSTNAKYIYNIDPAIRAAIMGHTSISTSDENYTKVSNEMLESKIAWY